MEGNENGLVSLRGQRVVCNGLGYGLILMGEGCLEAVFWFFMGVV